MATVTQPPILDTTGISIANSLNGIAEALEHSGGSVVTTKAQYDESPALYAHVINDIIYFNEHFYKVTSPISVGDTITVGSNVVAAELDADTPVYVADLPGAVEPEQGSITLSSNTASLSNEYQTATITATIVGDGAVSVSTSDSSVCTASISGSTITITVAGSGSATVTVTLADGVQYLGTTATISVSSTYVKIVSWANGTDAEIAAMVAAADDGKIDLYTDGGWRVGDERSVTIGAIASSGSYDGTSWSVGESQAGETVTMVLMHRGLYTLVTPVKDKSGNTRSVCSFIVGLKNALSTLGYMNSTNTNNGSWNSSARRGWCNGGFRQAVPSTLRSVFKQFNCVTAQTYNGSTNQTTQDYFALPAAAEVFKGDSTYGQGGTAGQQTAYSNLTEFNALTRFTYYETTSNRVKLQGDGGSAYIWWERSPRCNASTSFAYVGDDGSAGSNGASNTRGLAPFGCL